MHYTHRDRWLAMTLWGSLAAVAGGCMSKTAPAEASLTGTATFRERLALPANAVFEATLEDVSRADASAEVLGSTRMESPGNPPYTFTISYDPTRIDPTHRYAVRARITVDGSLMFTTDTQHAVLTQGQPDRVDILLRRAGSGAGSGVAAVPGVAAGAAAAADTALSARRLRGLYSYMADSGLFEDCETGQRLPVVQEADNAALEAAYSAARPAPGATLLAIVDGRIEDRKPMEGPVRPMLIVERFVSIAPGACSDGRPTATLENTYWKLMRLGSQPVTVADNQREPHFVLQSETKRVSGSGGCNRMMGSYTLDGDKLAFSQMAGTMMACPEGMDLEQAFHAALQKVAKWRIDGETLELFDAAGVSVAGFESRYMK
jgi:uncharacterized lipoprotein YbaY/heat shock protein HslJ